MEFPENWRQRQIPVRFGHKWRTITPSLCLCVIYKTEVHVMCIHMYDTHARIHMRAYAAQVRARAHFITINTCSLVFPHLIGSQNWCPVKLEKRKVCSLPPFLSLNPGNRWSGCLKRLFKIETTWNVVPKLYGPKSAQNGTVSQAPSVRSM